jgi:hypothetical protein
MVVGSNTRGVNPPTLEELDAIAKHQIQLVNLAYLRRVSSLKGKEIKNADHVCKAFQGVKLRVRAGTDQHGVLSGHGYGVYTAI